MVDALLLLSGIILATAGTWRGYVNARAALAPLAHEGDATRAAIEAARPLHARPRVRAAALHVLLAVGWLALAMYGLFLCSVASGTPA